jgi:very-short-patch-repair endonuclease
MNRENDSARRTPPELWAKLKPLVLEKWREPTPAEDRLWQMLRRHNLGGAKFRRQHVIGPFIVDFYCAAAQLVVEVDGPIHDLQQEEDKLRQDFLEQAGLTVLRFSNDEVVTHVGNVMMRIRRELDDIGPP